MLNYYKFIEIFISLQLIYISSMVPVLSTLSFTKKFNVNLDIPITFQIPIIILISLIFKKEIVFNALTIYILLGLFVIPIFYDGGSLGYLLTPNFGYLIGFYPLIKIINKLNNKNKIYFFEFIKYGFIGIISMHISGILYTFFQIIFYKDLNLFLYNIAKFSFGKIGYQLLMLIPLSLLIRPITYIKKVQK